MESRSPLVRAEAARALEEYRLEQQRKTRCALLHTPSEQLAENHQAIEKLLTEMLGREIEVEDESTPEDLIDNPISIHKVESLCFSYEPETYSRTGHRPSALRVLWGERQSQPITTLAFLGEVLQGAEDGTWYGWEGDI